MRQILVSEVPTGYAGSADIFQAEMMKLMEALEYVRAYIDDLLVITRGTLEDHLEKLRKVLRRLRGAGLTINATKSLFCTHKGTGDTRIRRSYGISSARYSITVTCGRSM